MSRYIVQVTKHPVSQPHPAAPSPQVRNNAGGYVFEIGMWDYLDRVLLCGTEAGTYYVKEQPLTLAALSHVQKCLASDPQRTIDRAVEFSVSGRSAKNDWPLAVLALAVTSAPTAEAPAVRAAWDALPKVARTWSHVYTFEALLRAFGYRKWGRAHKQALWAAMIGERSADNVAYQAVKYQERGGIRGSDLARAAHLMAQAQIKAGDRTGIPYVLEWMQRGRDGLHGEAPGLLWATEALKQPDITPTEAARFIELAGLPEQAVPTSLYKHPVVARAILGAMLGTALLRNLRRFDKAGMFEDKSAVDLVVSRLTSPDYIKRHRLHPMQILIAWRAYTAAGERHTGAIAQALETALSLSFGQQTPTGKTQVIALDVSGSMGGTSVNGSPLTCIEAQTVMALTALRADGPERVKVIAFDTVIKDFCLSPDMTYSDAVRAVGELVYGGTDCSLALQYVRDHAPDADALTIYTDSETWAGPHGFEVLNQINAARPERPLKVATVAMAANTFSTLPPDPNHLLAVGMDATLLTVLSSFLGVGEPTEDNQE